MNHTYIKIFKETTHEIASIGLYHNYAEEMSDKVLEMVVCIFLVHNLKNRVSVI